MWILDIAALILLPGSFAVKYPLNLPELNNKAEENNAAPDNMNASENASDN